MNFLAQLLPGVTRNLLGVTVTGNSKLMKRRWPRLAVAGRPYKFRRSCCQSPEVPTTEDKATLSHALYSALRCNPEYRLYIFAYIPYSTYNSKVMHDVSRWSNFQIRISLPQAQFWITVIIFLFFLCIFSRHLGLSFLALCIFPYSLLCCIPCLLPELPPILLNSDCTIVHGTGRKGTRNYSTTQPI